MIALEGVSKKFLICHEKEALIRNMLPNLLRKRSYQEFWALRDINLALSPGRSLGVIGRNGSGKTTLLNVICRITTPTEGRVDVKGKISTLLTLGAGFHPDLTGEENIFLNGTILGMTIAQIRNKLKEIVEFSGLREFIDTPLRAYSAGMQMRLGFAIAINTDFDILLVDEVFSVGDIGFQKKCLQEMKRIRSQGKTIVLVSQSLDLIKEFCDEAILMDNGKIICRGLSSDLINKYQEMMSLPKEMRVNNTIDIGSESCGLESHQQNNKAVKLNIPEQKSATGGPPTIISFKRDSSGLNTGTQDAQITKVSFFGLGKIEKTIFSTGETMRIEVDLVVNKEIDDPHFGIAIFRDNGVYCYGPNTMFDGIKIDKLKIGKGQFSIEYESLDLLPGKYLVSAAIWPKDEKLAYDNHYIRYSFEVISVKRDHGVCFMKHKWRLCLPK